jgi:choline dehydrogenase
LSATGYDYVIVGAGSAGCVVAARLAEDPAVRVCVIEAGPPDDEPAIHMPYAFPLLWRSRFDWDLTTDPEPGLLGDRTYLPRGRVLGGSSSLNAMVYIRGNRADFDEWADSGLAGWGYDDVLAYFIRAEDNERGASDYHGSGGPLTVSDGRSKHPLAAACIEAAVEAGIAATDDHNGAGQDGVGWWQRTQRAGRRCSTAVAYLHPAARRGNVDVLTDTPALRVLFDGDRATGVEILHDNRPSPVPATREVILCAGAYQSPQLLMLSGIGPAAELRAMGIVPRADLPVGRNLQDHPIVSVIFGTDQPSLRTAMTPANLERFEAHGEGPLTSSLTEAGLFVRTRAGLDAPDVQALIFPAAVGRNLLDPPSPADGCSISPILLKPTSRGSVVLRNTLPLTKPRIVHNYLETEEDRRTLTEGVRIALEMGSRPALRRLRTGDLAVPESGSDRDVLDFLRRWCHTVFHPVGTCAMGSVVDAELRVAGVEGLRVADASVMPTVPRGNTNAPTIMVAEKASDLIRGLPPLPPRTSRVEHADQAAAARTAA